MVVIGLTGSLCTGKSTVARMFAGRGAKVLNADTIAHQLIGPQSLSFKRILNVFGPSILTDGVIDRKKLAGIVFYDKSKLRQLEHIIHPAVGKKMQRQLKRLKQDGHTKVVILDVPLLFESGLNRLADYTIVVTATRQTQLKRAQRLKIAQAHAVRRIKNQWPLKDKVRQADIIIDNNTTLTQTQKQVKDIWQRLQRRIKN